MATTDRANTAHERQAAILERIATNAPLQGTLDELVLHVEDQIPGAIGSLLLMEPDGRRLRYVAGHGLPTSYHAQIDGVEVAIDTGSCGTAAYRCQPVFVSDIATDPIWEVHREVALRHDLRACWSTPIVSRRRTS